MQEQGYPCGHGLPIWTLRAARGWSAVLTVLAVARTRPPKHESHRCSTHAQERKTTESR
ncbi:hypothetical protein C8Q74DRAFT_1302710, partial [Fomes fomentarius]